MKNNFCFLKSDYYGGSVGKIVVAETSHNMVAPAHFDTKMNITGVL